MRQIVEEAVVDLEEKLVQAQKHSVPQDWPEYMHVRTHLEHTSYAYL